MLLELLYLFTLSLVSFTWLQPGQMILGHDSGVRLNGWDYWRDTFFSWNPGVNFGKDWAIAKGFLVTKVPELVLTDLFGTTLGQQLTIAFWLFAMGLSMYIAVRLIFPTATRIMRLWASTLYMYNFFVLQGWWIFERAKFATYAALPLVFAFLYKGLTKQYSVFTTAVLIGITLFFGNGGGSPPLYGTLLVTGAATFFFMTIVNMKRHGRKELIYSAKLLGAIIGTWFLLNAYWIVPEVYLYATSYASMLASMGGTEGILSWEAMFSTNASYFNILRLQGIPGWEDPNHPYAPLFMTNPLLIAASLVPLLLTLCSLLFIRKEKPSFRLLLILIIALLPIGVFFTAGTHPPLGFLFAAMIKYVPGFAIFRSSYFKFAPTVFFAISLLSAYSISQLVARISSSLIGHFVTVVVLVALIAYHFPYFQPDTFRWRPPFTTKITVPDYAYRATDYLNKNTQPTDRILLLPPLDPTFHQDSYAWGYWSLAPYLRNALSRPILTNDSNNPPTIVDALYQAIANTNEEQFLHLANTAGVTHVVWRGDILYNDRTTTAESFVAQKHALDSFPSVKPEKTFDKWMVYRVSEAESPLASATSDVIHVVDPTHDIASISNIAPNAFMLIEPESVTAPKELVTHEFIRALCISCREKERQELAEQYQRPVSSRFPSSHPLHFLTQIKEQSILAQATTPEQFLDAHLAFARKSELSAEEHAHHIKEIEVYFQKITGIHRYEYALKLLALNILHETMEQIIASPSDEVTERLILSIPENDTYMLHASDNREMKFLLNNVLTPSGRPVQLAAGLHTVEVPIAKGKTADDLPAIYFERQTNTRTANVQQPIVTRINPALVTVQMPQTDKPTLLTFNQHFSPGWKLVGPKEATSAKHVQVAGYANGWILPALAVPTTFTITYFPQQIFYIGLGITTISFASLAVLLFLNRQKI